MENNQPIAVLNAANEKIGSTYVKRAKGLVKKGRARFIDENTIVLADSGIPPCPPDKTNKIIAGDRVDLDYAKSNLPAGVSPPRQEDKMNELAIIKNNAENEEIVNCQTTGKLTDAEIFEELKLMREQLIDSHTTLEFFLSTIKDITEYTTSNPDYANINDIHNSSVSIINNINNAREETIRRLIDVYSILIQKNNR